MLKRTVYTQGDSSNRSLSYKKTERNMIEEKANFLEILFFCINA